MSAADAKIEPPPVISIWVVLIAVKSKSVMVTPTNVAPFGIDGCQKSRALSALARAGLIALERRRGRFPTATLLIGQGV